ncbi:MAG: ribonuclease III [Candidatus Promineifilaceae bacterium]|nr:ribonuclease III [Chloroflexota bacterium]MBK8934011.1 ribonuclease III [Chloroflexota bacterium]MBP7591623.1 ribonuclease III [Chloroflexota bacterium]
MNDSLPALEAIIGLKFTDYSLLTRALTHRSYLNENSNQVLEDNERLEFLGDAVLDFVVGAYLYNRLPEVDEGELTSLRAALVRANTLASFARQWELGRFLRLGFGEAESGGRERTPILCATFEAVIGAIYLDKGLPTTRELVEKLIAPTLITILDESLHKDAKSEFQVWAQARYNITPHYEVTATTGPDHAKVFMVAVMVGDKSWGEGQGRSKQTAAQAAARVAMAAAEQFDEELA